MTHIVKSFRHNFLVGFTFHLEPCVLKSRHLKWLDLYLLSLPLLTVQITRSKIMTMFGNS